MNIKLLLLILIMAFINTSLYSFESEDKTKVIVVGKLAKFVKWQDMSKYYFTITVLDNQYQDLFDEVYKNKKIKNKPVIIKYIKSMNELEETNILFISSIDTKKLAFILEKTNNKNILLVSDIRGFAQKGGMVQIYFSSRKPKLKINLDNAKKQHLKLSSSLLRIATIVRD